MPKQASSFGRLLSLAKHTLSPGVPTEPRSRSSAAINHSISATPPAAPGRRSWKAHTGGSNADFHSAGTLLVANGWDAADAALGPGPGPALADVDRHLHLRIQPGWTHRRWQRGPIDPVRGRSGAGIPDLRSSLPTRRINYARPSIHRDGRLLALGTDQGAALWDLARGTELAFLPIGLAWHLMFEPSGDLITIGSAGGQRWPIRLDPDRGEFRIGPPQRLAGFPPSDCGIAEDRSGRIVAVAYHNAVHIMTPEREFTVSHLDDCRGADVSPDGQWLATGSHQVGGVRIWRIADATEVAKLPIEGGSWATFSPDGNWLVAGNPGCRLWKVGTWEEGRQFGGMYRAFSPDGRQVVVQDTDKALHLVEIEDGAPWPIREPRPVRHRVDDLQPRRVAAGCVHQRRPGRARLGPAGDPPPPLRDGPRLGRAALSRDGSGGGDLAGLLEHRR